MYSLVTLSVTHLHITVKLQVVQKNNKQKWSEMVLWFKVTSMSSLTACPFSAVAAAAKSGFILLQNPHPIEENDHSNQQCNTNVLHAVYYFFDFLKCSNSFIAHFKTKSAKLWNCFEIRKYR